VKLKEPFDLLPPVKVIDDLLNLRLYLCDALTFEILNGPFLKEKLYYFGFAAGHSGLQGCESFS
jgi:hypothetical protein